MTIRFTCLFCGETCCSFEREEDMPLVFPWEKRSLEEKASKTGLKLEFKPAVVFEIDRDTAAVALYRWIIRGRCPFLDDKGLCRIHEEKPLSCKMFPLLVGWDDKTLRVSGACPWVRDNIEKIKRLDPSKVFPEEFKAAVKALAVLEEFSRFDHVLIGFGFFSCFAASTFFTK
jgi:Fe-S-cluster containining protein